jgi:8-oxo-dGTP pyrophosphatase MutT (NUDIX family)
MHLVLLLVAARETDEETGFDPGELIEPKHCICTYLSGQQSTMYIVPGVPEDFPFAPKVRLQHIRLQHIYMYIYNVHA